MQHKTQVYQARVPFINKNAENFFSTVLEFTKLEYHIIIFNRTNLTQQCHDGRTDEDLEFWKKW